MRDYPEDYTTVNFKFPSKSLAAVPTAITGGTFAVYKGNNTTQSTAGLTFTSGFDGITGLNNILIDLSSDAFYETGEDYSVVAIAGTVDSISIIGEVVFEFSIENEYMRGTNGANTIAPNTVVPLDATATQAAANAALVANHLDHIFAVDYNPNSKPGVATALFNELIQSAGGVSQFTATALEQGSSDTNIVFDGVTNSGSSDITVVLENSASNQDNFYRHESMIIDGENRLILGYAGSIRTAVLDAPLINGAPSNNTPVIIMGGSRVFTAAQRLGYTDDTVFINSAGDSGTILEVNGIEDNPSDNIADATVIAAAHSPAITKFDLASGTTVTPTQTYTNWQWLGRAATINFNNQQYPNNTFERHFVSGTISASTASQFRILSCQVDAAITIPMNALFANCSIRGDITFNATGELIISDCNNINAITIDWGAAIATGLGFIADHNGDVTHSNITGSQVVTHTGNGSITLDASCTGGELIYGGNIPLTNNGSTTTTNLGASSGGGDITSILGTALSETTASRLADNFSFFYDNNDADTTKTVDDVGVAGSGLTAQAVRDAMKLAPTAGAPAAGSIDLHLDTIEADTDDLQGNQGDWLTATGFSTFDGDLSSLATLAAQSTMQGNVTSILADTDNLQTNQNNWLTATGFSTFNPAVDVVANVTLVDTTTANTDMVAAAPTAVQNRTEMDSNSTQLAAIVSSTTDLAIQKNTALSNFEFLMVLSSDHVTPAAGLTVTAQRSIDGGAFGGMAGVITEVSNGIYKLNAFASDTNGDLITWRFLAATADDTFLTFKTVT